MSRILLAAIALVSLHRGMELAPPQHNIMPRQKLEKLLSLKNYLQSHDLSENHLEQANNLVALMDKFNDTSGLEESLGMALQTALEDRDSPYSYLPIYALKILAESCELLTEAFLRKYRIIPSLLQMALTDSLAAGSPRKIAVKIVTILRSLYCRLGTNITETSDTLKRLYLEAKDAKPHYHLAAASLYVCVLIYPIHPISWKPENMLRETVALLESGDEKAQVLCLESLLHIQGPALARHFVELEGLELMAGLLRSTSIKVSSYACFALSMLLGENSALILDFILSGCFHLVLSIAKSANLLKVSAAMTVLGQLASSNISPITYGPDRMSIYETLISVLSSEYNWDTVGIDIVMESLQILEKLVEQSNQSQIFLEMNHSRMKELGLDGILDRLSESPIPVVSSQASKIKDLMFG